MALNKKGKIKATKDELRKDDLAEESAAPTKANGKAKVTVNAKPKATAKAPAKAKPKVPAKAKPVKVPKELAGKSNATSDSGTHGRRLVGDGVGLRDAAGEQELDPFEVAKQTMKGSVPAIVKAMVELAKQGSCPHAKTLLEMTGAKHMFIGESEAESGGEPWAKLVLKRLDEAESEGEQETVCHQEESVSIAE